MGRAAHAATGESLMTDTTPPPDMIALGATPAGSWRVSPHAVDLTRPRGLTRAARVRSDTKTLSIDTRRTAMVVIDMQNDFCHPDGWLASIGVDVAPARAPIAPLQAFLPRLRAVDIPVIWVNWGARLDKMNLSPALLHVYNGDGRGHGLGDALPNTGAPVLTEGSWSAAIVDELSPDTRDIHVAKHRMSGFWDTPLDSILRNLDVKTLLFGGVNADQCVLHTLADANFLGYDTIMVEDCCATTSPEFCWRATLYNVRQIFGFVARSDAFDI
jgi:nicotinamidase-related amidase